jgi:cell division septation protein DedD
MLKNTDRYKKDDETHFANSEYKKKSPKKSYKDITVFISVFFIGLLIILGFAKILSPNVDVEIADNEEYSEFNDEEPAGTIDERLKKLQMDDATNSGDDKMFSPELDEKVVLPSQTKKTEGEMEIELQKAKKLEEKASENHTEQKAEEKAQSAPSPNANPNITYKVVVGQYATDKQAEVAKSILQDAGLGVSPIVKNIGGSYTLQVGAFSSKEKAQQLSNHLLKSNFPARIVE